MNIIKLIKNRINNNLNDKNNEAGFSMLEGVIAIGVMTIITVIGVGSENSAFKDLLNQAKQVQTASLAQTTMTNIVFYDLDADSETNEKSAVRDFNNENVKKGFTAFAERNNDCIAVQVIADNGLYSIEKTGSDCDAIVEKLEKNVDLFKEPEVVDSESNTGVDLSVLEDNIPDDILSLFSGDN